MFAYFSTNSACFDNAVGVSSPNIIPDSFIRASTSRGDFHRPAYGRLNGDRWDGWCALLADDTPKDWLQIDFGKVIEVCGVATQGDINSNEYPIDFKLHFSSSGDKFKRYKDGNGENMVRFYHIFRKHKKIKRCSEGRIRLFLFSNST